LTISDVSHRKYDNTIALELEKVIAVHREAGTQMSLEEAKTFTNYLRGLGDKTPPGEIATFIEGTFARKSEIAQRVAQRAAEAAEEAASMSRGSKTGLVIAGVVIVNQIAKEVHAGESPVAATGKVVKQMAIAAATAPIEDVKTIRQAAGEFVGAVNDQARAHRIAEGMDRQQGMDAYERMSVDPANAPIVIPRGTNQARLIDSTGGAIIQGIGDAAKGAYDATIGQFDWLWK